MIGDKIKLEGPYRKKRRRPNWLLVIAILFSSYIGYHIFIYMRSLI